MIRQSSTSGSRVKDCCDCANGVLVTETVRKPEIVLAHCDAHVLASTLLRNSLVVPPDDEN
uniref:Uncharacterized protein n=1 Tax=Physcomitrium patens TaxID=3218 RepID=A0A2K1K415_PHYPA|nr:hypothetical protein PHYPA_012991 [Physcomitrium patens]